MATPTPASQGFRMPAEWEPHAATWLAWPYNLETWEGHLEGAERAFVEMIEALAPHEKVELLVPNAKVHERAAAKLKSLRLPPSALEIHDIESGDVWFRDYGPIFVVRDHDGKREVAWTKWGYNAYGGKYDDLLIGNEVPDKMPITHLPRFDGGMILEGGSIDVNGKGSLLTSEQCLLSPDRNPNLTRDQIQQRLCDFFGATNVLWLGEGIAGDDTTGHVDDLARFTAPSTVMTTVERDPSDANYKALQENLKRLRTMKDEAGNPLTVVEIPMPRPFGVEGRRMAATHINFYIANGVVLMPAYAQPSDQETLAILRDCFPGRRVIGIDCREMIWGYGSIHCASQQQPL